LAFLWASMMAWTDGFTPDADCADGGGLAIGAEAESAAEEG